MRLLGMTCLVFMLSVGGASDASADRGGRGRGGGKVVVRGGGGDRVIVRDHRGPGPKYKRGRVIVSRGRYVFPGGVVRVYRRPVVRRYYDVRVRPPLVVEAYDPVPGYVWVRGHWYWGGGEWIWAPGYWDADAGVEVQAGFSAGVVIH